MNSTRDQRFCDSTARSPVGEAYSSAQVRTLAGNSTALASRARVQRALWGRRRIYSRSPDSHLQSAKDSSRYFLFGQYDAYEHVRRHSKWLPLRPTNNSPAIPVHESLFIRQSSHALCGLVLPLLFITHIMCITCYLRSDIVVLNSRIHATATQDSICWACRL